MLRTELINFSMLPDCSFSGRCFSYFLYITYAFTNSGSKVTIFLMTFTLFTVPFVELLSRVHVFVLFAVFVIFILLVAHYFLGLACTELV